MNAKTCPACRQVSFSSNTLSTWTCPYCQQDLTQLPLEPAKRPKLIVTDDNKAQHTH